MENRAKQFNQKSSEMPQGREGVGKSTKRSPLDKKPIVWQMAEQNESLSDHPCMGPFPTD